MATVLGIDPGVTGAWALVRTNNSGPPTILQLADLPTRAVKTARRVIHKVDALAFGVTLDVLLDEGVDRVVIEKLTGSKGIASTTAFSLGWTAATLDILMRLRDRPYIEAHPSVWKKALLVPAEKPAARRAATVLFGNDKHWPRESHHNRAEAAMIALYGALRR